jgi:hypothetical protein
MKSGGLNMKSSPKGWDQHEVGPGVGHGVGGWVVVAGRRCRGLAGLRWGVAQEWVMGRGKDTQVLGFVWHRLVHSHQVREPRRLWGRLRLQTSVWYPAEFADLLCTKLGLDVPVSLFLNEVELGTGHVLCTPQNISSTYEFWILTMDDAGIIQARGHSAWTVQ